MLQASLRWAFGCVVDFYCLCEYFLGLVIWVRVALFMLFVIWWFYGCLFYRSCLILIGIVFLVCVACGLEVVC